MDFWAPWCPPCNILSPVLENLAEERDGKFILAKINVAKNEKRAREYGIMGIPAVKMFKDGGVVAEFVGARPEEEVKEWLDKNLK